MIYTLMNTTTLDILRREDFNSAPPQLPLAKGLQWVVVREIAPPVIDEATQRNDQAPLTLQEDGTYGRAWTTVALTQQEIDIRAARVAAETAERDARVAAAAAFAAQFASDTDALNIAKADTVVKYLVNHTPAEISTYVQTSVTSLATAKDLLAKLAVAVSVLAKDRLR